MAEEMRCSNCKWWREDAESSDQDWGRCHRYPPVLNDTLLAELAHEDQDALIAAECASLVVAWCRPSVRGEDFCGEFKPKQTEG